MSRLRHLFRMLAYYDALIEDARESEYACALKAAQARTSVIRSTCRRASHAQRAAVSVDA